MKKNCQKCNILKEEKGGFAPMNVKWSVSGYSDMCIDCMEKSFSPTNLNDVDSLMRYLNWPLRLDDWTRLYSTNGQKTLTMYLKMFTDGIYAKDLIDWKMFNEKWIAAIADGTVEEEVAVLQNDWMVSMRAKWQMDLTMAEFRQLEQIYEDVAATQNMNPGLSDIFGLMLCKKIFLTDQKIRKGEETKNDIAEIKNLMAVGDFEAKGSRAGSDFNTVGELFSWLVRYGWKPKFYDGKSRDEVDLTIKDIQAYLRRLVLGEAGLTDMVQDRQRTYLSSKQLEEDVFMTDSETDEYDVHTMAGAYEGDIDLSDYEELKNE